MRISLPPGIYKRLQLFFGKPHVDSAHCLECSDRAAIAKRELCNLPFLSQVPVHAVLFNRHLEHLAGRSTVDVAAILKYLAAPRLAGKPSNHPRLDRGEICHIELHAFSRNKSSADQLRERVRNIIVKKIQCFRVSTTYQCSSFSKIAHMVLRKILQLHEPSRKTASAVCSIELEHAPAPAVSACGILHRLILLDGRLGKLLPKFQRL